MKIKICAENVDKICEALDAKQSKCRVRTISAEDVIRMTEIVEERLCIPKSALKGVRFSADCNAQAFPNAYKGIPDSTIIRAEHNGRDWYLTGVYRATTRRPTVAYDVCLTDKAKAKIIERCTVFG